MVDKVIRVKRFFPCSLSAACSTDLLVHRDSDSQGGRGDDRGGCDGEGTVITDWIKEVKSSGFIFRL